MVITATSPLALDDHARIERNAERGIGYDAQQRPAALQARAVGEQAIVGEHGADAGENRVGVMADLLHVRAGAFAGNPAAVVFGRGDLAVQRERRFQSHQRKPGSHRVDEGFIQPRRFVGIFRGDFHRDAGLMQSAKTLTGNLRIGIFHGGNHSRDARARPKRPRKAGCGHDESRVRA